MPPSPSLRRSPGREPRIDIHKRGRSLESGLSFKQKDEDLALFNEMQSKERDNFLLLPTDDFEDICSSKLKRFPDFKIGVTIPARGESSDLLNAEGDKNDYDWLLTPPDSPLFPSLDDDPTPSNLVHSGRPRSRPIAISRSLTMETNHRSSRGSSSPQRLSPSPQSRSTFQPRGRPSSAPHSSPTRICSSTPSRRPSPPPVKPSTPPPRSLTPTSRRASTGSSATAVSSRVRGTSPARTGRGNSASPKISTWQSNIPGFSLEAPPNLRTDRAAAYVRGSSPVSRTSRDSSSKLGRRSMSPAASRSISSSHSQEHDKLSLHSKGSLASSGDDDADSLQSVPVSGSEYSLSARGVSRRPTGKPMAFSRKPNNPCSSSSAPKRSFDSAMRQMDRNRPKNMFRPLLSSVPSTSVHVRKTTTSYYTMMSRNSSITTSSNASSDHAQSGAHDTEGSEQNQDDVTSECRISSAPDNQDEIFAFDKIDVASSTVDIRPVDSEAFDNEGASPSVDISEKTCDKCGRKYHDIESSEVLRNICPECKEKEERLIIPAALTDTDDTQKISGERSVAELILIQPESQNVTDKGDLMNDNETLNREIKTAYGPSDAVDEHCKMQKKSKFSDSKIDVTEGTEIMHDQETAYGSSDALDAHYVTQKNSDHCDSKTDVTEGTGISVLLLRRSSSIKGPLLQGRTISASAMSYDDVSYARDLTASTRSSVGYGSLSTSSSVDLSSSRRADTLVQRQLSARRSEMSSNPQSSGSSFSGISSHAYQGFSHSTSTCGEDYESIGGMRPALKAEIHELSDKRVLPSENHELLEKEPSFTKAVSSTGYIDNDDASHIEKDACTPDFSGITRSTQLAIEIDQGIPGRSRSVENASQSIVGFESSLLEETKPVNSGQEIEVTEVLAQDSLPTMSEIEVDDSHPSSPRSQIDAGAKDELQDPTVLTHPDHHATDMIPDSNDSERVQEITESSTVTMEDQSRRMPRSLTLEEATDTILFCSSIIHDLAFKAANIAIEKEKENLEPFEGSRPTITIPDRPVSVRKDASASSTGKRAVKPQKTRQRRSSETEKKPPLSSTENDDRSEEPRVRNVGVPNNGESMKPPKLESKCNCTIM